MGVEYMHLLSASGDVIDDFEVVERLHGVLRGLGVTNVPTVYDVHDGRCDEQGRGLEEARGLANVMLRYGPLEGAAVARTMGPSAFENADADRYLRDVVVIVGDEYRVYSGEEGCDCPSAEEGADLGRVSFEWCGAAQRPGTTPFLEDPPKGFDGLFRTCIAFDCGKDMPAFVMDGPIGLDPVVVEVFEQALGRSVFELGRVY